MDTKPSPRLIAAALALLAVSCTGQQAPARTPLPPVADAVPEPAPCRFLLGTGSGARILEVTPGSAADGSLLPEDIIVAVDGAGIESFDQLREAVGRSAVGQRLSIDFERSGRTATAQVVLQPAADDPTRPMLGVRGSTVLDPVDPADLPTRLATESALTRTVAVDGKLYRYDPASGSAAALGLDTPSVPWAFVGGRLFTLSPVGADRAQLESDQRPVATPAGVEVLLGVVGEEILLTVNEGGSRSVVLLDPDSGTVGYTIPFSAVIPFLGFPSPDGTRLLIGAGTATTDYSFTLYDAVAGTAIASDLSLIQNAVVTGWFDDRRLLVATTEQGVGLLVPTSGEFQPTTVQTNLTGDESVYPLGDGLHALILTGSDLVLAGVGDVPLEARPVISGCGVESVGRFGG